MKFLTDFRYRILHGFARFPGDSTALVCHAFVRMVYPFTEFRWIVPGYEVPALQQRAYALWLHTAVSVSTEIYSGIERFPCNSTALQLQSTRVAAAAAVEEVEVAEVWPVEVSPKKRYIDLYQKNFRYFTHLPRSPREPICMKFGTGGRLADIINCVKFCDDRIRGFHSTRGRISAIPIDLGCRR